MVTTAIRLSVDFESKSNYICIQRLMHRTCDDLTVMDSTAVMTARRLYALNRLESVMYLSFGAVQRATML